MSKGEMLWCEKGTIFGYKPDYDLTIIETTGGGTIELPGCVGDPDEEIEIIVRRREDLHAKWRKEGRPIPTPIPREEA